MTHETDSERMSRLEKALVAYDGNNSFLLDIRMKLRTFKHLTYRQWQAVESTLTREAAKSKAADVKAGRQVLRGTIVKYDSRSNPYVFNQVQHKMTVELADGGRVWGTVPAALLDAVDYYSDLEGREVVFTASVKPTPDDPKFGFFSRPTNAELVPLAG